MTTATEQGDDARAIASISANILIYSFFPLLAMVAHDRSDIFVTLFYSQLAGFAFAAVFARRKPLREIGADVGRAPMLLATMSAASVMIGGFMLWSLHYTSGITAAIALELWPLFGLLFVARFVKKDWKAFTPFHGFLFLVAAIGVLVLAYLENSDSDVTGAASFWSFGVMLAVLASISSGATLVQTQLYYVYERTPSFRGACYTIMMLRGAALVPTLGLALVFGDDLGSIDAMIWGGLLGLTAYGLASVLAIVGLRYSTNLIHILLWYMTPVLASAWIMLFLDQRLSDLHVIAFMPILLANIFSNVRRIRRVSFFVMSIFSLVAGVVIYMTEHAENEQFYSAVGVIMTAYAIIVSFILQRKLADIRGLGMELAEALAKARQRDLDESAVLATLSGEMELSHDGAQRRALRLQDTDELRLVADKIRVERVTSFASAEAVVLCVLTMSLIVLCLAFRGAGFAADVTAFALSVSAVFLTLFTLECSSVTFQWRIAKAAVLPDGANGGRARDSIFLSIAGTAVLIALVASLLVDKWLIDILDTVLI